MRWSAIELVDRERVDARGELEEAVSVASLKLWLDEIKHLSDLDFSR